MNGTLCEPKSPYIERFLATLAASHHGNIFCLIIFTVTDLDNRGLLGTCNYSQNLAALFKFFLSFYVPLGTKWPMVVITHGLVV